LGVFRLRGSPTGKVTVSRFLTVPLKGNKLEYDYLGSTDVPCSMSLFPQAGQSPCWHLRRNPTSQRPSRAIPQFHALCGAAKGAFS